MLTDLLQGSRLVINVDVSNTTFWSEGGIDMIACQMTGCSNPHDLAIKCRKVVRSLGEPETESPTFKDLRKLRKSQFYARYRGSENSE